MIILKKKLLIFLFVSLSCTFLMKAQKSEKVDTGKIYFLRSTGVAGSGYAFKMFIDGKLVCKLNNKKYSKHEVAIGKHICFVKGQKTNSDERNENFEVNVEKGKTTYVQLIYQVGIFKGYRLYFEEISEDIARKRIEEMEEDKTYL